MVMADAFHLGWMGATKRLFHIADAFNQLKYDVVIIAGKYTNKKDQANIDKQFPGLVIRTSHSGAYPIILDNNNLTRRTWRALWKFRGQEYYWSQLSVGWGHKLNLEWLTNYFKSNDIQPSLVWSADGGYIDGAFAARRISNFLKVPWIMELHDPPRGAGLGSERVHVKNIFSELIFDASNIVVTSETYKDDLIRGYGISKSKIHAIHLTFDNISRISKNELEKYFVITYLGHINSDQSLLPILYALEEAIIKLPDMALSCRLIFAGKGPGFIEVENYIVGKKIEQISFFKGVLSQKQVFEYLSISSVIIILQGTEAHKQIPGKIFECLNIGKPILGMMPRNSEAAQILFRSGLGFIHESNDITGIRNTLIKLWESWKKGNEIVKPDKEYISQFSSDSLMGKIKLILIANGFKDNSC